LHEENLSIRLLVDHAKYLQKSRLPAPGFSHDADELSFLHGKIQSFQDFNIILALFKGRLLIIPNQIFYFQYMHYPCFLLSRFNLRITYHPNNCWIKYTITK